MNRLIVDIPAQGADQPTLQSLCQALNSTCQLSILGSENKIRILDDGNTPVAAYQAVIDGHDSIGPKMVRNIENKVAEISAYAQTRATERFDYNGNNFAGDDVAKTRFLAKRIHAVEWNQQNPGGPAYSQKWTANGVEVYLSEQDFRNIEYLLSVRDEEEVFNAVDAIQHMMATCITPEQVISYDYESTWGALP